MLSLDEVATKLGCDVAQVEELVKNKELHSVTLGGKKFVLPGDLRLYIRSHVVDGKGRRQIQEG